MTVGSNAFATGKSTAGTTDTPTVAGTAELFASDSSPNPAIALLYFFIITAIYCIINIFTGNGNTMQKVIMKSCYLLAVVVGEFFINLNLSYQMCGVYQWQSILFITIIPWLLIFSVMHIFLTMFPGWLSPFSNTFGYLVVKLMGLPDLMAEIVSDKPSKDAYNAISSLKNDPSLLINQFSPELVVDEKDPKSGEIKQTRPLFDGIWQNLKDSKVIQDFMGDEKKNDKYREKLYKYVDMKYTMSEFIWNLLGGGLVTSVSYNYIISIGCSNSAEQIKARHDAYQLRENKKINNNEIKQANEPNYRQ